MTWFKVDDGFWSSSKVLSIPKRNRLAAVGLWLLAGNWCAHELKDGAVPGYVLDSLGATVTLRNALVEARLWLDRGSAGIEFVNWLEFQPSREHVETKRAKHRDNQRSYAERAGRKRVTDSSVSGSLIDQGPVSDNPPTRPDPSLSSSTKKTTTRGTRLDPDWTPPKAVIDAMRAECPAVDLKAEHAVFVDYWIAQPGAKGVKSDWPATWRNWMRRKQGEQKTSRPTRQTPTERAMQTLSLAGTLRELE